MTAMQQEPSSSSISTLDASVTQLFEPLLKQKNGDRYALILAAANEVIPKQSARSAVAFFAAICPVAEKEKNEQRLVEMLHIISFLSPQIPNSVFRSRADFMMNLYASLMDKFKKSEKVLRPLLSCCTHLIKEQDTAIFAGENEFFNKVLSYLSDSRYELKQAANTCVQNLLDAKKPKLSKYIMQYISNNVNRAVGQYATKEFQSLVDMLATLQKVASHISAKEFIPLAKTLLKLPALGNTTLTLSTFQVFDAYFKHKESTLSQEAISPLIKSLHQCNPGNKDAKLMNAYMNMLTHAYLKFSLIDHQTFETDSITFFTEFAQYLSERQEIEVVAAQGISKLIKFTISETNIEEAEGYFKKNRAAMNDDEITANAPFLIQLIQILRGCLNLKNKANLDVVLDLFANLFEKLAKKALPLLTDMLLTCTKLKEQSDFKFQSSAIKVISKAISAVGPEQVLKLVPLNLTSSTEEPRMWLLPVLRDNITNTSYAYFFEHFYPIALKLEENAKLEEQRQNKVTAKNLQNLHAQIMALLPGFAIYPIDNNFSAVFSKYGKELATIIEKKETANIGCNCLLKFINKHKDFKPVQNVKFTAEQAKAVIDTLSSFSKNFYPILLNAFSENEVQSNRDIIAATLEAYASISDPAVVNGYFKETLKKLLQTDAAASSVQTTSDVQGKLIRKKVMTDLLALLIKYLTDETIELTYKVLKPQLVDQDNQLQKKTYKSILEILKLCKANPSLKFLSKNMLDIIQTLSETLSQLSSPSKKYRLKCLRIIIDQCNQSTLQQILPQYLGELLMSLKENNVKTRKVCTECLQLIANKMAFGAAVVEDKSNIGEEGKKRLCTYGKGLLAGLGGKTALMISATVEALTLFIQDYAVHINDIVLDILTSVLMLAKSTNHQVLESVFQFILTCFKLLNPTFLTNFVPPLTNDLLNHLKQGSTPVPSLQFQIKKIFKKMIKRFGEETVKKSVPKEFDTFFHHVVKTIRNTENRKKRHEEAKKKAGKKKREDSDMILQDSANIDDEGDDANVMDLLDPQGLVANSKPAKKQVAINTASKKSQDSFKKNEQGKIIVEEEEPEDKKSKTAGRKRTREEDEDRKAMMDSDNEEEEAASKAEDDEDEGSSKRRRTGEDKTDTTFKKKKKVYDPLSKANLGKEYKAKRSGGDIKKKNKPDPFAYLPLDPARLNRRHQFKESAFKKFNDISKKK